MEKEQWKESEHIDLCLRVCGYKVDRDLIDLILAFQHSLEDLGDEMTLRDMLALKRKHIKDE